MVATSFRGLLTLLPLSFAGGSMSNNRRAPVGVFDVCLPPEGRHDEGARRNHGFQSTRPARERRQAPGLCAYYKRVRFCVWVWGAARLILLTDLRSFINNASCLCVWQLCPHIPMSRIEFKTHATNTIIPYGLLVRVWEHGTEPDLHNPLHYRSPRDPRKLP